MKGHQSELNANLQSEGHIITSHADFTFRKKNSHCIDLFVIAIDSSFVFL